MLQHDICIVGSSVPVSLFEFCARPPGCHVELKRIDVVLGGVCDAIIKILHRQAVISVSQRETSKICESASRMILKVIRQREPQTLFEFAASVFITNK